jgi:hypothetical protein
MAEGCLSLLLKNSHHLIVDKDERVILNNNGIIGRVDLTKVHIKDEFIMGALALLRTQVLPWLLGLGIKAANALINDLIPLDIFLLSPDLLIPFNIPQLFHLSILLIAPIRVANMFGQTTETVLMRLSLRLENILKLETTLFLQ